MFNYLKVKNNKGVKYLELNGLGKINVLFGKNNSGKTSIIEAVNIKECVAVGKPLEDITPLVHYFEQEASQYFDNITRKATNAFRTYLEGLKDKKTIWYYGEEDSIIKICTMDLESNKNLHFLNKMFDMHTILKNWFRDIEETFQPLLIPPKRKLEARVEINLKQKIENYGSGIVNYLFFLKNQNPSSNEFKTFTKIYTAFSEICDYEFNIIPDLKNTIQLVFKRLTEEKWIFANDSGLGLADLLIMITFALDTQHSLICLEEPESHLHPEMQKRLLSFLKGIEDKQFIISTHSNIFLNSLLVNKIYHVQYRNKEVHLSDETSNASILFNLGYSVSDHLIADAIILVENPSDIPVLNTVLMWVGLDRRFNINFFPLNGDIRAYLDLSMFLEKKNVFSLTYSKGDTEIVTDRFNKNCEKNGIQVYRLKRASIENYFDLSSIRNIVGDGIPNDLETLEPNISVDAQLGFSLQHKSIRIHNSKIINSMDRTHLESTDLLSFCLQIKSALDEKPRIEFRPEEHKIIDFAEKYA